MLRRIFLEEYTELRNCKLKKHTLILTNRFHWYIVRCSTE